MARESGQGAGRRAGDRGRYGRLNRERVLATALEVVDREGLGALSMRRLGAELGVEAMALYRYAAGKEDLLDGLVEALYLELEAVLADEAGAPSANASRPSAAWRAELHRIARATYSVALHHPHAVPLLATRMLAVPLARRPAAVLRDHERVLTLLRQGGLEDAAAAKAHRAYTAWLLGYVFVELRAMVDAPDESDPAFRLGLHRMPPQEFPRLRAAAADLAERQGAEGLATGLDALLDRCVPDGDDSPTAEAGGDGSSTAETGPGDGPSR
ncbi:TetR/AcrR family transcriptional regulator [Streptomyces sp. 11x1]|uniref:TetR/AcrR family transcriptional regulator n=1 Tax=Streptomyces sp. 11x1 TaxID=3038642 RepID=UPI00292DC88E|nr:TetR/AcrR family transcriptional regulator [Streptomyces sp. 11x1]WNZ11799.1 TetR/AcrR family transcriptional regulator [Streptomyces sp. 11x1]